MSYLFKAMEITGRLCPSPVMTQWLAAVVIGVTVIAMIGLMLGWLLRRDAASRYVVMSGCFILILVLPSLPGIAGRIGIRPFSGVEMHVLQRPRDTVAVQENRQIQARDFGGQALALDVRGVAGMFVLIWAIAAVVMVARVVRGWIVVRRLLRTAAPVRDADILAAAAQIGPPFAPLVISGVLRAPVTVGLYHTTIVLPHELIGRLSRDEWGQILRHELAHVRRWDHGVALLQRLGVALFWPHPLLHALDRCISRAREELCDNYAVGASSSSAVSYGRTLLHVMELLNSPTPAYRAGVGDGLQSGGAMLALALPPWNLEHRVRSLLDERRSVMVRCNHRWVLVASLALAPVALLTARAGISYAQEPAAATTTVAATHVVKFDLGDSEFHGGDSITITEVRGAADDLHPDGTYTVKGRYKLASHAEATLLFCTTAIEAKDGVGTTDPKQSVIVKKGEGEFTLTAKLVKGYPHVSFYPTPAGDCFGGVYFGRGDSLLTKKTWSYKADSK